MPTPRSTALVVNAFIPLSRLDSVTRKILQGSTRAEDVRLPVKTFREICDSSSALNSYGTWRALCWLRKHKYIWRIYSDSNRCWQYQINTFTLTQLDNALSAN